MIFHERWFRDELPEENTRVSKILMLENFSSSKYLKKVGSCNILERKNAYFLVLSYFWVKSVST